MERQEERQTKWFWRKIFWLTWIGMVIVRKEVVDVSLCTLQWKEKSSPSFHLERIHLCGCIHVLQGDCLVEGRMAMWSLMKFSQWWWQLVPISKRKYDFLKKQGIVTIRTADDSRLSDSLYDSNQPHVPGFVDWWTSGDARLLFAPCGKYNNNCKYEGHCHGKNWTTWVGESEFKQLETCCSVRE